MSKNMETVSEDPKKLLKESNPISVGFDHFVQTLEQYAINTEHKIANMFHLLPDRTSGKVHIDIEKLLALTHLFPNKESNLDVYIMDRIGVLVEDESHYLFLPHDPLTQ